MHLVFLVAQGLGTQSPIQVCADGVAARRILEAMTRRFDTAPFGTGFQHDIQNDLRLATVASDIQLDSIQSQSQLLANLDYNYPIGLVLVPPSRKASFSPITLPFW
jgi:hypothetical protein